MFKIFRIIFTIVSAAAVAVAFFLGVYSGISYALIAAAGALISFGIAMFFKSKQLEEEHPAENDNKFLRSKEDEHDKK